MLRRITASTHAPSDMAGLLQRALEQWRNVDELLGHPAGTFEEEWDRFVQSQERYRGRTLIGLRTGLDLLDANTLGLRGLCLLAAQPNAGKTALAIHLGIGVARHHTVNDAAVVLISLDMLREEIHDRIFCNVAEIDWQTWKFGTARVEAHCGGPRFALRDQPRIDQATQRLQREQIARRFLVHDLTTLGADITAEGLVAIGTALKRKLGVSRIFYVVDYLQLLPVPPEVERQGDLAADRHRIAMVKNMVRITRTADNPDGDCVLAITETRKPSKAKDAWGADLSEVLGAVRNAYAPDCVLTCWPMTEKDLKAWYGIEGKEGQERWLRQQQMQGIAPVMLCLAKGRDGMTKGRWPLEFHFRQSRFTLRRETIPDADDGAPAADASPVAGDTGTGSRPSPDGSDLEAICHEVVLGGDGASALPARRHRRRDGGNGDSAS